MKKLLVFILLFCFSTLVSSDEKFKIYPIDDGLKDKSFYAFREQLKQAAKNKDKNFIINALDKNIKYSFGEQPNDAKQGFIDNLKLNKKNSQFYNDFYKFLQQSARKEADGSFVIPYHWNNPKEISVCNTNKNENNYLGVILGKDVNLREKPSINSKILKTFSYDVVYIEGLGDENQPWTKIRDITDKKIVGYVSNKYIGTGYALRAFFVKKNKKWVMDFFVAGD